MIKFKNKNPEFSLHLLIWLVLFFLPAAFSYGSEIDWGNIFKHFWLQLIFLAVVFYINYLFLVHWLFGEKNFIFHNQCNFIGSINLSKRRNFCFI
jgi:hypothetical protein